MKLNLIMNTAGMLWLINNCDFRVFCFFVGANTRFPDLNTSVCLRKAFRPVDAVPRTPEK